MELHGQGLEASRDACCIHVSQKYENAYVEQDQMPDVGWPELMRCQ